MNQQVSGSKWSAGGIILVVLVLIAAASIYIVQSAPAIAGESVESPVAARFGEVAGFREDAWYLPADDMLGFVEIPAGPFIMGSDASRDPQSFANERWVGDGTPGTVDLPTYYIGRYEVTVAQYAAFIDATGHPVDDVALYGRPDQPVASVSWPDALAYARWLEERLKDWEGTPPALASLLNDGWHVTLPTEAQWEKAARGTDGRIYPWGDVPARNLANFESGSALPVGSFDCQACPYGIQDMSGNVWEWTRSPYQATPYGAPEGREDLEADALWTMRGGSFADQVNLVRAAVRGGGDPGARRPFIGFRLVISRD